MRKTALRVAVALVVASGAALAQTGPVPAAVGVPAGHAFAMKTVGVGELTYECRVKAAEAGAFEWTFVGPEARLLDAPGGRTVGRYYAGPTWEASDGSKVTGKQVAVAPGSPDSIPLQLVKAEPMPGAGVLAGVTYVQRLNTKGGVAPAEPCAAANAGSRRQVAYEADYLFFRSEARG